MHFQRGRKWNCKREKEEGDIWFMNFTLHEWIYR